MMEFLTSDAFLSIVALIFTTFFGGDKLSQYISKIKNEKLRKVTETLATAGAIGVEKTYKEFTREIKKGREDGKLTDEERKQALNMAKDTAIAYAKNEGVDLAKEVGMDALEFAIESALALAKKKLNK